MHSMSYSATMDIGYRPVVAHQYYANTREEAASVVKITLFRCMFSYSDVISFTLLQDFQIFITIRSISSAHASLL